MRVDALFPIPILSHEIDSKIADDVEQKFLRNENQLPWGTDHRGDFYTKEKVLDLVNDLPELYAEILKCRDAFYQASGIDSTAPDELESWIQDYSSEGLHHKRHSHGINGISGVYWIRADEEAAPLKFYNPNIVSTYVSTSRSNAFSWKTYIYKPKKGTILVFPSYIEHEVERAPKDSIRTTLAFNFPFLIGKQ